MLNAAKKYGIQFLVMAVGLYALGKVSPATKQKIVDPTGTL